MAGFPNLAQLMGDDIVTVYVGPREKRYSVHKALLTSQSEYFEKALNGNFKEADEQTIRLPEDSPDAFELLIGWLYQNQIPSLGYVPGPFDEFPRGLVVGTTKLGNAVLPPNRGTGSVAYQPHEDLISTIFMQAATNNNPRDRFNHICTQSEYNQYSQDELRLEDYALNHRFSELPRPSPENVLIPDFPVSSGRIDDIPYCSPIEPIMESEEAHQLALIRLCLFAETICWTSLFNIAMSTYIQGESFLAHRPMPTEHIELIYERAHPDSSCRKYAADATISQINAAGQIDRNMDLVEQWPTFLEDIFKRLRLSPGLSRTHGPKSRGPCEYHVHDAKHQLESCLAASEAQTFLLDARVPTKRPFVAQTQNSGRPSGDSENTGSENDDTTEIWYSDNHAGDTMDWGSGWNPWLRGGGIYVTPTGGFGSTNGSGSTGGFGQTPIQRCGTGWYESTGGYGGFGNSGPAFGPFGGTGAPISADPTTAADYASSHRDGELGSTGTTALSPQAATTANLPASSSLPQTPISVSITSENGLGSVSKLKETEHAVGHNPVTSPNTSASTASSAIATSAGGLAETGSLNATNQGLNPTFGQISPLASPLTSLTAKATNFDRIFGQKLSSSSSTANPGSFFPTAEPPPITNIPTRSGSAGTSPISPSSSGTDASRAHPPSRSTASTSPLGLLGAHSTPVSNPFSPFEATPRASGADLPANSSPSNLSGIKSESNVLPSNAASIGAPSNVGTLPGLTPGASSVDAPAQSSPSNLYGLWSESNISSSSAASTDTPSDTRTLFGSTSRSSDTNIPAKSVSSNLFGLRK
ncbi:hypothetical protein V493_05412 [Pseudogymnoascus sp. VKM F-4281 (FW-2241)]|nr:hypothetical protein V493_05412 [Pseudogymnoascus sp. VKM F-4281 (FW-2241)]